MLELSIVSQQIAIAGKVLQGETENPISGAIVEIVEMPVKFGNILSLKALQYGDKWSTMWERPDRKITFSDGGFSFTNLPAGEYLLEVYLMTNTTLYNKERKAVIVSSIVNGKVPTTMTNIVLSPTGIKGQITNIDEPEKLVANAKVRIQETGDSTISDRQGNYRFIGLESAKSGTRTITLIVSATGYQQLSQSLEIKRGQVISDQNLALKPK